MYQHYAILHNVNYRTFVYYCNIFFELCKYFETFFCSREHRQTTTKRPPKHRAKKIFSFADCTIIILCYICPQKRAKE